MVSLYLACQAAMAAPAAAALAPWDSLGHWCGGKHPHLPLGPLLCHQPGRADSVWEHRAGTSG